MKKYNINPCNINLEITESALMEDKTNLLDNMNRLMEYGVKFSLDDFGTGHSNLNYIVDMPVNIVKFDKGMLDAYFENGRAKYVMDAAMHMIQGMNLLENWTTLEKAGKLKGVVTQNIDGLHQKAGSKNVMELHGSVLRNYCERCGQFVSAEDILHSEGVPVCPVCGGPVKPDVVLYEEGLNQKTLQDAVFYISHADMLIVGGTSLAVYPAAGLIDYYRGSKLVLINKSVTSRDSQADLVISDSIGKVLGAVVE